MQERVWLYLVVSSDAQEDSLPAQKRWGYEEAARIGAQVERVFEGVATGKHGARRVLLELIEKLSTLPKSERPSRVLMNRLDRTGRMPLDAISALNEIRKLGVTIRDRINGDYTFQRVIDQVGPIFQLLQAGFENEVRSDRSKAGHKRRRDEGKLVAAKPPYGVMRDAKGFAVQDPRCAPFVQESFQRWNAGDSPAEIVRWLRENAPPRIGKGGREIYIGWTLSHVYKMVHLETYRGLVLDEMTWQRAQKRKRPEAKPGPGGRWYPFSGARCACGDRLHARTSTSPTRYVRTDGTVAVYQRKKPTVWYVCHSMKHPVGPKFRNYPEDLLEIQWVHVLRRLQQENGAWIIGERTVSAAPRIDSLKRRIDALVARRHRIHTAFEEGVYDAKTMQERLSGVDREEQLLIDEIEAARTEHVAQQKRRIERQRITDLLRDVVDHYRRGTREERTRLNRAIFSAFGVPVIDDHYRVRLLDLSATSSR